MAVLQIIYLAINVIGIVAGLIYFIRDTECYIFSDLFSAIHKRFKNVGLCFITLLLIALFIPAIAFLSAAILFITSYGTYSDQEKIDYD